LEKPNALGVSNTINPEYDTAVVFAEKLIMEGVWSIYSITDDVKIAEVSIPEEYFGRKFSQLDPEEMEDLTVIALKFPDKKLSTPSLGKWSSIDYLKIDKEFILEKEMRLVIKGRKKDIIDFLKL
jgi:Trk K+ transport system NAD-binding subunit